MLYTYNILIKLKCRQYLKDVIHYVLVTCWYTLKRISNWPLYKIWYYATYLINASKVWLRCIVHANLSIKGNKDVHFHVQNCTCGTAGTKIDKVLGFLVHGKVVVEIGRNVFLVDCLLWKPLNIAKISLTERTPAYWCTRKLQV